MKSTESLRRSYDIQRKIFEDAESRRIENAIKQKAELERKIDSLLQKIAELEKRIDQPREFESFDSFRQKIETLSNESKRKKELSSSTS